MTDTTDISDAMLKRRKEFGYFTNPLGYDLVKLRNERYFYIFSKSIYRFTLDPQNPLTFHHPDGRKMLPVAEMETDMGSTPKFLNLFFPKDKYLKAFIFHDSGWLKMGMWVMEPLTDEFVFEQMTYCQMNDLLGLMCSATGASRIGRKMIHAGVNAGARFRR